MSSYKKAYAYTKRKRNWVPLWYQRFHHRHPTAWLWTSGAGMFLFMYHRSFVAYYKRLTLSPEEYKIWVDSENMKRDLRIRYGEGIRLPFSSTTINLYSDREIELMKVRDQRLKQEEEKLLAGGD